MMRGLSVDDFLAQKELPDRGERPPQHLIDTCFAPIPMTPSQQQQQQQHKGKNKINLDGPTYQCTRCFYLGFCEVEMEYHAR